MIGLMAFLGNPGKEYAKTRHNAGFMLCDYLYPGMTYQMKYHSQFAKAGSIMILRPMTFMNLSGTAVSEAASFLKLKSDEILVVHDDTELPIGTARLQKGGGLQGHKGLRSIKERIGSDSFYRLRIGIGKPRHGDLALFVTTPFTEDERITLSSLFPLCRKLLSSPEKEGSVSVQN